MRFNLSSSPERIMSRQWDVKFCGPLDITGVPWAETTIERAFWDNEFNKVRLKLKLRMSTLSVYVAVGFSTLS